VRAAVILDPNAQDPLAIGAGDETDNGIIEVWLDYPGSGRGLGDDGRGAAGEPGIPGDETLAVYSGRNVSAFWDLKLVTLTARRFVQLTTRASYR
jgi:hypothetical protein